MSFTRFIRPLPLGMAVLALFVLQPATAPAAQAGSPGGAAAWSALHLTEPLEIPGRVLEPGDYVVRLARTESGQSLVEILGQDQMRLFARLMTTQTERLDPATRAELTYVPTGSGEARRALASWTVPGTRIVQDFIYPAAREESFQMAASMKPSVTQSQHPSEEVTAAVTGFDTGLVQDTPTLLAEIPPPGVPAPLTSLQTRDLTATNAGSEPKIASSLTSAPSGLPAQQAMKPTALPRSASSTPALALAGLALLLLGSSGLALAWARDRAS